MRNVTVSMDELLLKKARVAAAEEGKSLSKFIAETIEQRVGRQRTQAEALERFLAGPLWDSGGGRLPTRDEIYAERLHRHERADLSARQGFADEGGSSGYVAESPGRAERGSDKPAGDQ